MTNCNIIIPTFNRPVYLKRILSYYSDSETAYNIIVADSSSDENKELNKKTISAVSNLAIQYLDDYPTKINSHHKLADVVNYAEGKYCLFCADDDFVTPNGINQSVDFLEQNPDFTVAHGQYIGFYLEDDDREKQQFCWKPVDSHESITFPEAKNRLIFHFSNYNPTIFAVHRTELLKMVYKEALKSKVDPLFFGELLPSMLTLIYGKMKRLDVLYAARDSGSIRCGYWPSLKDAIKAGIFNEEYAKFRDCLSIHLSQQSQLDMEKSRKVVDDAMSAYMKKYYPSKSKKGYILDYLRLPDRIDKEIRGLYTELTGSRYVKKYSIDMPPSSKYYDDFSRIRHHVLSYSKINIE